MEAIRTCQEFINNTLRQIGLMEFIGPWVWFERNRHHYEYCKSESIQADFFRYNMKSVGYLGYASTKRLSIIHGYFQGDQDASQIVHSLWHPQGDSLGARWWLKPILSYKKEYRYVNGTLANLSQYDYFIASRSAHALNHLAQYPQTSMSEFCAYIGFQTKRLAKALLRLHDDPYVNYQLPDFSARIPVGLETTAVPETSEKNEFFKVAFDRLSAIEGSLFEDDDMVQMLKLAQVDCQQLYWCNGRELPSTSNVSSLSIQTLTDHLRYLALMGYFEQLIKRYQQHESIYYKAPEKKFEQKTLMEIIEVPFVHPDSPVDQWYHDLRAIDRWADYWCRVIDAHYPKKNYLVEDKIREHNEVVDKHLSVIYHPDRLPAHREKFANDIFSFMPQRKENMKNRFRKAKSRATLRALDQGKSISSSPRPRATFYQNIPVIEQVFFHNVLRDKVCNVHQRGLWHGPVVAETQTRQLSLQSVDCALEAQTKSAFTSVQRVAKRLRSLLTSSQTVEDQHFYSTLHYLLSYFPNPEFTIEYKMLFADTKKRTMPHQPHDTLPNFIDALLNVYLNDDTNAADQARLRRFMQDIIRHQNGQTQLDVRYLLYRASHLYQHYSSGAQKKLGWCLIGLGVTLLVGCAASLMLITPALMGGVLKVLSAMTCLMMASFMMVAGKACVGQRPFFRSKRFDVLKYKAKEIHPHFDYIYLTDPERLDQFVSYYQVFSRCINMDISLQFMNPEIFERVDHQRHWCHGVNLELKPLPVDDLATFESEQIHPNYKQ